MLKLSLAAGNGNIRRTAAGKIREKEILRKLAPEVDTTEGFRERG